jgi:outer membrane lipoprotein SlyB
MERNAMKLFFKALMAVLATLMLAACSSPGGVMGGGGPPEPEIRTGVVEQINLTEVKSTHDQGLGAILGGVAGAGIGSLIGAGTGRDVAIAAGAIAGAIGGNVAQNRYFDKPQPAQQVFVRLRSGVLIAITQPVNPAIARGMRVYVEGTGHDARVIPAT